MDFPNGPNILYVNISYPLRRHRKQSHWAIIPGEPIWNFGTIPDIKWKSGWNWILGNNFVNPNRTPVEINQKISQNLDSSNCSFSKLKITKKKLMSVERKKKYQNGSRGRVYRCCLERVDWILFWYVRTCTHQSMCGTCCGVLQVSEERTICTNGDSCRLSYWAQDYY